MYRDKKDKNGCFQRNREPSLFVCNDCRTSFIKRSDLLKHLRIHTVRKLCLCVICNFTFYNQRALENHLKSHNDEKRYKCGYCEWTFRNDSDLKRHLHTCQAQGSFKSGIYGMDVCQKSSQSDHLQLHNEEHQVKSITCNQKCTNDCELNKHMNVSAVCQEVYENLFTQKAKRIDILSNPSSAVLLPCAETLPRPENPFQPRSSPAQWIPYVPTSIPVQGELFGPGQRSEAAKFSGITRTAADPETLTYSTLRVHHVPATHHGGSSQYEDRSEYRTGFKIPQNLNATRNCSRPQAKAHYGIGSERNPGSLMLPRKYNEKLALSLSASQHEEKLHYGQATQSNPSFLIGNVTSTSMLISETCSQIDSQTSFVHQNSFAHNMPYEQKNINVPGRPGTFETSSGFEDFDVDDTQTSDFTVSERGTEFAGSGTLHGNQTSYGLRTQSGPQILSGTVADSGLGPHLGSSPPNEHLEHFVKELYMDPVVLSAFKTYLEGLQDEI